ncbi:MAG: hypothetical protein AB1758_19360 [Candidatus Eremiobacterota bacterium]
MTTLFSWGYEGWGNWTERLVAAVDAVESSRGWGPPMFVDVRARRSVRAAGFRDSTFEKRFGSQRYRWMPGLGNAAIRGGQPGLVDERQVGDLLNLGIELAAQGRRVIFFCSCASPGRDCHRHWVTDALVEEAMRLGRAITVVEWPGFESERDRIGSAEVKPGVLKDLGIRRKSLPLGDPALEELSRPWFTPVEVSGGYVLTGPAQYRAGSWQLPIMSEVMPWNTALLTQLERRRSQGTLPAASPHGKPGQRPLAWDDNSPGSSQSPLRLDPDVIEAIDSRIERVEAGRQGGRAGWIRALIHGELGIPLPEDPHEEARERLAGRENPWPLQAEEPPFRVQRRPSWR